MQRIERLSPGYQDNRLVAVHEDVPFVRLLYRFTTDAARHRMSLWRHPVAGPGLGASHVDFERLVRRACHRVGHVHAASGAGDLVGAAVLGGLGLACGSANAQRYALGAPPVRLDDRPPPPPQPSPNAPASTVMTVARRVSRPRLIAALTIVTLLIVAAGVFAGVTLVQHRNRAGNAPSVTAAASAHTFTGTYRADYGPGTDLDGKPVAGAPAMTATWGVRSACGAGGCVATASYVGGSGIVLVSNLVFDEVGGSWIAVGLG
jgi:hypothetical protein